MRTALTPPTLTVDDWSCALDWAIESVRNIAARAMLLNRHFILNLIASIIGIEPFDGGYGNLLKQTPKRFHDSKLDRSRPKF
jgi:hypothetical protein